VTPVYLVIGAIVFWLIATVIAVIVAVVVLVAAAWWYIQLREWLRKTAARKVEAFVAKRALTPPPVHPSEAETAKLPTITLTTDAPKAP